MKPLATVLLAGLLLCGAAHAQQTSASQVLGTMKTYSTIAGSHYERDTTLMRDGSLEGVVRDDIIVTKVTISSINNDQMLVIARKPWGVSTSVSSLSAYRSFAAAHPAEMLALNNLAEEFHQTAAKNERTELGVMPMVGNCGAQYNAMIQAGDHAIATCATYGQGQACVLAYEAYHATANAFNTCMHGSYRPPASN